MTVLAPCVVCQHTAEEGRVVCARCSDELWTALRRLAETYAIVATSTILREPARTSDSGRTGSGYGSRSPANEDLIVLTDPRTTIDEDLRARSVPAVLSQWVRLVAEETGTPAPAQATVTGDIHYLLGLWSWITCQPWITELAGEVGELTAATAAAMRELHRAVSIGPCPVRVLDLNTDEIQPCGQALRVRPDADRIRCPACGTAWPRADWDQLRAALGDPRSDYAQLAAWLGVSPGTLRRWCAQDHWTPDPARTRGRATWLRAEALASWTRRRGTDPGEHPA